MKKFSKVLVSLLALTIAATSLVACSAPTNDSNTSSSATPGTTLKADATLEGIVTKINEEIGIQMPAPLDDTLLSDMFYITSDMVDEYYGQFSMTMTSADNVIAVKAAPDKVADVAAALEKRKEDVEASFSQYLPDQYEKAQAGKVITKGDYVFLVMIGDYEKGLDKEMAKAEEIINSFFN